jgi:hypothetical protein
MLQLVSDRTSRGEAHFPYMLRVSLFEEINRRDGSGCNLRDETVVMVREGLLARLSQDGQQASIHIGIEAGVGKVGFQQK